MSYEAYDRECRMKYGESADVHEGRKLDALNKGRPHQRTTIYWIGKKRNPRCDCGWKWRSFVGPDALKNAMKAQAQHEELHREHGDAICPHCHEAPLEGGSKCEFCLDRDNELRMEEEDALRDTDRDEREDDEP